MIFQGDKMKKKHEKIFLIILVITISSIIAITSTIIYYKNTHKVNKDFTSIDLEGVDNLMIVAHPDDDILWGGAHLIKDNYLVVCITCGTNPVRVDEFVRVMHATNDKYIMLGYPDKTNGERDNWDNHRDNISANLNDIINLTDWNIIVTHNPDGEYGHQHHKMTSALTTKNVRSNNLYYFGRYHSKKAIANYYDEMAPISDKYLSRKKKIIGIYKSQKFIQTMFDHMYPYEDWVKATEWSENTNE